MAAREVLRDNLRALMRASSRYTSTPAIERRTAELGTKVGKSTIDRVLKCETTLNLDFVEAIAAVFGLDAWQIMAPGLDPKKPPVLRSTGVIEDELYRAMREASVKIAKLSQDQEPESTGK